MVARIESIRVNDTLIVGVRTECKPCVWIDRDNAGLVSIRPDEVQPLIEALSEAAGLLAEGEARRASSSRAVVEARRLRRRRIGGDSEGGAGAPARQIRSPRGEGSDEH